MHAHLTPNVSFFTKHIRLLSCQRPLANSISNTIILGRSTCTQYNKVTSSRCINQNQCAPVLKGTFGLPLPSCSCSVNLKSQFNIHFCLSCLKNTKYVVSLFTSQSPCKYKQAQEADSRKPPANISFSSDQDHRMAHIH